MIKQKLQKHGYCIIKNIISPEEIETAKGYFENLATFNSKNR